jgi:hypothetical protein
MHHYETVILKECTIASTDLSHSATRLDVPKRTHSFTSERVKWKFALKWKTKSTYGWGEGNFQYDYTSFKTACMKGVTFLTVEHKTLLRPGQTNVGCGKQKVSGRNGACLSLNTSHCFWELPGAICYMAVEISAGKTCTLHLADNCYDKIFRIQVPLIYVLLHYNLSRVIPASEPLW